MNKEPTTLEDMLRHGVIVCTWTDHGRRWLIAAGGAYLNLYVSRPNPRESSPWYHSGAVRGQNETFYEKTAAKAVDEAEKWMEELKVETKDPARLRELTDY